MRKMIYINIESNKNKCKVWDIQCNEKMTYHNGDFKDNVEEKNLNVIDEVSVVDDDEREISGN